MNTYTTLSLSLSNIYIFRCVLVHAASYSTGTSGAYPRVYLVHGLPSTKALYVIKFFSQLFRPGSTCPAFSSSWEAQQSPICPLTKYSVRLTTNMRQFTPRWFALAIRGRQQQDIHYGPLCDRVAGTPEVILGE